MAGSYPFDPFHLTCIDHTAPKIHFSQFLCFRDVPHERIDRLQAGVEKLISSLPFLSGEVVPSDDPNSTLGQLMIRPATAHVQNIPMMTVKEFPNHILPPNQYQKPRHPDTGLDIASLDQTFCPLPAASSLSDPRPVIRFQANLLADGLMLGLSFNHMVFDGTGSGTIIEMLAACCRTSLTTQDPPLLPTTTKIEANLRKHVASLGSNQVYVIDIDHSREYGPVKESPDASEYDKADAARFSVTDLRTTPFVFSDKKIVALRDECNRLLPSLLGPANGCTDKDKSSHVSPQFLSSNDIVTTLLSLCIERARNTASAVIAMAVNLRERVDPPLPPHYLGDALNLANVHFTVPEPDETTKIDKDTDTRTIARIAAQLRATLQSIDDKLIRSTVSYLNRQSDWNNIDLTLRGTVVSSWRHLKVYELDFGAGLGRIDDFEMQLGLMDRLCVILPAARDENENGGGGGRRAPWDVRVTLQAECMERFVRDPLLRGVLE